MRYTRGRSLRNAAICASHKILDFYCALHYVRRCGQGAGSFRSNAQSGKGTSKMFKVEDMQNYGKEQFETVVATATGVQNGLQAIASAYGDYTKKSYRGHQVLRGEALGREVARQGDRGADRIRQDAPTRPSSPIRRRSPSLYGDLAKQAFKPLEGIVSKFTPRRALSIFGFAKTKSPAVSAGLFFSRRLGRAIIARRAAWRSA